MLSATRGGWIMADSLNGPEPAGGLVGDPAAQVLAGEPGVALLLGAGLTGRYIRKGEHLTVRHDRLAGDDPCAPQVGDPDGDVAVAGRLGLGQVHRYLPRACRLRAAMGT